MYNQHGGSRDYVEPAHLLHAEIVFSSLEEMNDKTD